MKNTETKIYKRKSKKLKWVMLISILIIAIVAGIFSYYAYLASTDKIYEGVCVAGVDLGGKSEKEAAVILSQKFDVDDLTIHLKCEDTQFDIYGSQISLNADFEASAKDAVQYGKKGNIFSKISKMNSLKDKPQNISLRLVCDMDMLSYAINEQLSEKVVDVTEYNVAIGENCIIVTNGKSGRGVNPHKVMELVSQAYSNGSVSEAIEVEIETLEPAKIDPQLFFDEYNRDPVDAVCEQNGDSINIIPEVVGIKLDHDETIRILEENADNEQSFEIPAQITHPQVTAAQLEAEFTDCIIGTYTTNYSSSSANRKENIRLASTSINGVILNPGEVFSYNQIVGPRTESAGYKIAHVFSGGKTVDGIGGGICQVSSTLYNAVVFADLEIVYRTNHSLPVSYVPLGRDATVSYGTIDFKFKNNKETPIKIEVIADGSNLTVNIYGRKKYIKDISIETSVTGSIPYSTTEIKDDTMYEGETKVEEAGANGTKVEAYKVVKEDGVVVSKTLLAKSSYVPTTKVVRVGTMKRESQAVVNPSPEPAPQPEPEPQPEPDSQPTPEPPAQNPQNTDSQTGSAA